MKTSEEVLRFFNRMKDGKMEGSTYIEEISRVFDLSKRFYVDVLEIEFKFYREYSNKERERAKEDIKSIKEDLYAIIGFIELNENFEFDSVIPDHMSLEEYNKLVIKVGDLRRSVDRTMKRLLETDNKLREE